MLNHWHFKKRLSLEFAKFISHWK